MLTEGEKLTDTQLGIVRELLVPTLEQVAVSMGNMLRGRMKVELLGFGDGVFDSISDPRQGRIFRVRSMGAVYWSNPRLDRKIN